MTRCADFPEEQRRYGHVRDSSMIEGLRQAGRTSAMLAMYYRRSRLSLPPILKRIVADTENPRLRLYVTLAGATLF